MGGHRHNRGMGKSEKGREEMYFDPGGAIGTRCMCCQF